MSNSQFEIEWIDHSREPQNDPDPAYPNGVDVDAARGAACACKVNLPYPAKRCGNFVVRCLTCGFTAAITTAGRADDPRSVTVPCKIKGPSQ